MSNYWMTFNLFSVNMIYQLQKNSSFKDSFLEVVKDFPQYRELEYIVNKMT